MNVDKISFTNKTTTDYSEYMNSVFRMIKSPTTISICEIKPESIIVGDHYGLQISKFLLFKNYNE
jgi:hypothetical protein